MNGSDTTVTCRFVCHPCSEWAAQLFVLLLEVLRSLCISQSPQRIESNIFLTVHWFLQIHHLIKLCMSVTYVLNLIGSALLILTSKRQRYHP
jgi:hypothetical protein